jgi:CheY-like chemotaxis protein
LYDANTSALRLKTTMKILVIDDEPFLQTMTIHLLQQLGYQQIEKACDGADAIKVMQDSRIPFELVVCDLNMPVMDGFGFMEAAQAINYRGALIVLSSETPQRLAEAIALGKACSLRVLGALRKPLDREALQKMLMDTDVSLS